MCSDSRIPRQCRKFCSSRHLMTSGDRCSAVGKESISVTWVWFRCLRWQLGPWWCLQYCVSPCQVEFCRTVQCIDRRAFEAAFGSRAGSDLGKTTFARLPTSMCLCHSDSVLENDSKSQDSGPGNGFCGEAPYRKRISSHPRMPLEIHKSLPHTSKSKFASAAWGCLKLWLDLSRKLHCSRDRISAALELPDI